MIVGYSNGFHDAAMSVITDSGDIVYAGHAERYSRVKGDKNHCGSMPVYTGTTVFYEDPTLKNERLTYAGQEVLVRPEYDQYCEHHWSHAAACYYTRPYEEEPVCVVIDAIGEWDTCSIWYNKEKVWSTKYPYSLGLFYSAITQRCGLKPMEDEYITMGMAAYGEPIYDLEYLLEMNLHKGCGNILPNAKRSDIAASAQHLLETKIIEIMNKAKEYSDYLCYGGGVALNCVANSKIYDMFRKVWIFPNPGDAGSSLGATAAYLDKKLKWKDCFLGNDIKRELDVKGIIKELLKNRVVGVANGKAEFGPRALGNRSLLGDPRYNIKDKVNDIKQRQRYRPFSPAILAEHASTFFSGPMNEYMQYVAHAKHDYNSVVHIDNTSRVQKVYNGNLRIILEEWYDQTGCPMLLNTSLNIKGQPIVNTWDDAEDFMKRYNVKCF